MTVFLPGRGTSDPYCVCEISGKAKTGFKTQAAKREHGEWENENDDNDDEEDDDEDDEEDGSHPFFDNAMKCFF